MNRTLLLAALAATALSACDKSDHNIVAGSKEDNVTVNTAAVVLPPSIESSQSYRCKDNSVVYIDWLNDKKTADVSATKGGTATRLTSAEAGKAMTAAGYSLTGTKDSKSITLERPGKASQSCKS
ncbi:MAG: hypothetical protein M3N06_02035 [Pseudomonadota bacterium]|jgi:hypothetical protein|nr:hypothetical protein [Pseudomonadota bacterium]